jgi:hypothetical protein
VGKQTLFIYFPPCTVVHTASKQQQAATRNKQQQAATSSKSSSKSINHINNLSFIKSQSQDINNVSSNRG